MNNDHERLTTGNLVSQPQLRSLEMTGRMVLLAASNQFRQFGAGDMGLLKSYTDTDDIVATYVRTSNSVEDIPGGLVVKLGSSFMEISLYRDYINNHGQLVTRTDLARLAPESGMLHTYIDSDHIRQPLANNALKKFSDTLGATVERNEIILDRTIL